MREAPRACGAEGRGKDIKDIRDIKDTKDKESAVSSVSFVLAVLYVLYVLCFSRLADHPLFGPNAREGGTVALYAR
jgi:hypothetical protein